MVSRLVVCVTIVALAGPAGAEVSDYQTVVTEAARRRSDLASRAGRRPGAALVAAARAEILASVEQLAARWLGTAWGLGAPQTTEPGSGHINCGTFVGRVLQDAGFVVDVAKLQRQPSQEIIRSFVRPERIKKWSNAPIERFVADVRRMGPGLFIIGLDFHVGFLIQTDDDLRFVHASYETLEVVDEPAESAGPIVSSGYRVVGKLLDDRNVRDWLAGRRIQVKGSW